MKATNLISAAVSALGLVVLVVGYSLGYEPLTTIIPGANSMKPVTAAMFVTSGLIVPFAYHTRGAIGGATLAWLIVNISVLAAAGWSGAAHALGLGEWLPTLNAGPPSLGTLLAFAVVEIIAIRELFGRKPDRRYGWALVAVGVSSTLGYLFGVPALYFEFGSYGAMAIHTGIAFLALGVACLKGARK